MIAVALPTAVLLLPNRIQKSTGFELARFMTLERDSFNCTVWTGFNPNPEHAPVERSETDISATWWRLLPVMPHASIAVAGTLSFASFFK